MAIRVVSWWTMSAALILGGASCGEERAALDGPTGSVDGHQALADKLVDARTAEERLAALSALDRRYDALRKSAGVARGDADRLRAFRRVVAPALVRTFRLRIDGRYVGPAATLGRLVSFDSDAAPTAALFLEILEGYAGGRYYGTEGEVDRVTSIAVKGLAGMAGRGRHVDQALRGVSQLVDRILRRGRDATQSKGAWRLDPRSLVRNQVVLGASSLIKNAKDRPAAVGLLVRILLRGLEPESKQDPMVTIYAIRALGDVGTIGADGVRALVRSLYGKGRGRSFASFAIAALAKLPRDASGAHPATGALLRLLSGDPWGGAKKIKSIKMPACSLPRAHRYLCQIFWRARRAHREEWYPPQEIEQQAIHALAAIGEDDAVSGLLAAYGTVALEKRWIDEALTRAAKAGRPVRDPTAIRRQGLPGTYSQRFLISRHRRDAELAAEVLEAVARLEGAVPDQRVGDALLWALRWRGSTAVNRAAAKAAFFAVRRRRLVQALTELSTRAVTPASKLGARIELARKALSGVLFTRDRCIASIRKPMMALWRTCRRASGWLKAEWSCLLRLETLWKDWLRYEVGFHRPGDPVKLVPRPCRSTNTWWNQDRPRLLKRLRSTTGRAADEVRARLYACDSAPSSAGTQPRRCGEWPKCEARANTDCLEKYQRARLLYHRQAALLATAGEVEPLLAIEAEALASADKARLEVPGPTSPFFDPVEQQLHGRDLLPRDMERARQRRALIEIRQELCVDRRLLQLAKGCADRVACYAAVLDGTLPTGVDQAPCRGYDGTAPDRRVGGWWLELKALRMLAHLGRAAGPRSATAREALVSALSFYPRTRKKAGATQMRRLRRGILLVLDRVARLQDHRGLQCPALTGRRQAATGKAAGNCFQSLKRVIEEETKLRVKDVWQINRDARAALGRLLRRAGERGGYGAL